MLPIDDNLPSAILEVAQKTFPLLEPTPVIHSKIDFSADGVTVTKEEKGIEWRFYGANKEKTLVIAREGRHREKTAITIDYSKYESFNSLKDEFLSILNKCAEVFPEAKIGRIGLRYVNNININERNPLSWNNYINAALLSNFRFADDKKSISRVFSNFEMKYDDMSIKFQFGMHNPDYPSPIKKKIFILDYDVYYNGICDKNDVPDMIDKYHDKIISLFERSIKDRLRDKMNA
jgi:uncharacterized protein (TIGR04255 family)